MVRWCWVSFQLKWQCCTSIEHEMTKTFHKLVFSVHFCTPRGRHPHGAAASSSLFIFFTTVSLTVSSRISCIVLSHLVINNVDNIWLDRVCIFGYGSAQKQMHEIWQWPFIIMEYAINFQGVVGWCDGAG